MDTPDASSITKVTFVGLSAVTHTFNQGQRISRAAFSSVAGAVNVTAPSGPNLAPPGYYMLFLLNSAGVPSTARMIRLESPTSPAPPSGLTATAASSSQINLNWTDNATNETGFKIERCQGSACTNFAQIATVGANVTM